MMEVENQPVQTIQEVEMKSFPEELSVEAQLKVEEERRNPNANHDSERLSQIVAEYRKIQESSSGEIEKKRSVVRSKCQERLWMAAVWRDYQLDIIKRSYDAEVKQIEREHQTEFNNLKDSLMQELQEERKRLQALEGTNPSNLNIDKAGNLVESQTANDAATAALLMAEEQASGRRLRRREEKAADAASSITSSQPSNNAAVTSSSRRKQANNIYTFNTLLQEQDILDDLGAIAKEAGSLAPTRRSGNKATAAIISNGATASTPTGIVNVSFEKGALHYNWDIVSVGDKLRVQMTPNTSPIQASVTAFTATEVTISTSSGRTVKIPVADLKTGKVSLILSGHDHEE